jgi:hypothetical protein
MDYILNMIIMRSKFPVFFHVHMKGPLLSIFVVHDWSIMVGCISPLNISYGLYSQYDHHVIRISSIFSCSHERTSAFYIVVHDWSIMVGCISPLNISYGLYSQHDHHVIQISSIFSCSHERTSAFYICCT